LPPRNTTFRGHRTQLQRQYVTEIADMSPDDPAAAVGARAANRRF
jgi:hypothetical protein